MSDNRIVSPPAAFARFLAAHPEYAATDALDRLRASEYGRLDVERHIYLDYTGGGLYGASQIREHQALLTDRVFGNPHSASICSTATTDLVEQTRRAVLKYFNAPPDEYTAVFTANATGALKLVGEAYPFAAGGRFLLTFDNHNSVNGIREFARAQGRARGLRAADAPDLRHRSASACDALLAAGRSAGGQSLRLPGAVQFLRREASARLIERGARAMAGTCCWMPRRSCRRTGWT